jgi:exosome complex RNA-binding protein Csl4
MSAVPEIGAIVSFQNPITLTSCHSLKALNHERRSVSSGHRHSKQKKAYNLPAQDTIRSDLDILPQISRLTPLQANLTISLVSSRPTPQSQEDFQGLIKLSDVRLTEKDKLKMGECFRLGDVVRAEVVSRRRS